MRGLPSRRAGGSLVSWLIATALVALVLAPLWPTLAWLLTHPVPRFALQGDYASLEVQARLVPTGGTLLGPYSRFGFNHPGPAYFFLLWPFVALGGASSTGLFIGPLAIAALSVVAILHGLARYASRAHAVGGAAVLLVWIMAFGNTIAMPWNPAVIALPMLAFALHAAFVMAGRVSAAPISALFGVLVAHTHLSCVPYVVGISAAACAAWWLRGRRGTQRSGQTRRALALSLAILAVTSVPVVVELAGAGEGNLTKVARLFLHRPEPPKPWAEAWSGFEQASAWLPRRAEDGAMAREEHEPDPLWSLPFGPAGSGSRGRIELWAVLVGASTLVAARRRDGVSLALLVSACLGSVLALVGLRGIVGESFRYLHFWATTPTTLGWMGIATTLTAAVDGLIPRHRRPGGAALRGMAVAVAGVAIATGAARASRLVDASTHLRGVGEGDPLVGFADAYRQLEAHLAREQAVPVIRGGIGWYLNTTLILERLKDARPVRVIAGERWLFGRQFDAPSSQERALYVYAHHGSLPFKLAPCLDLAARSGDVAFYVGTASIEECPK